MAAAPPTRKIFSAGGYSLKAETAPSTFFLGQSHRPWHLKRSSYAQDSSQGRVKEPEPVLNARKTPDQQEIPRANRVPIEGWYLPFGVAKPMVRRGVACDARKCRAPPRCRGSDPPLLVAASWVIFGSRKRLPSAIALERRTRSTLRDFNG